MSIDKRTGWLKDLKEGDKVIVQSRYNTSIKTITKITPSGRIKIESDQFDSFGQQSPGDKWYPVYLEQWTQKKEDDMKRIINFKKMCSYLEDKKWKQCDYKFIKSVYDFIQDMENACKKDC